MKTRYMPIALLVVLIISISGCSTQTQSNLAQSEGIKYTLFIGLNDKDTYTQKVSNEEAEKKVAEIAMKYVDGFTQLQGKGAYKDEKGIVTNENTLILSFDFATEEQIKGIASEVLKELNQNSVLIEKQKINYEYYEGTKP